jgi:hypothetical protein
LPQNGFRKNADALRLLRPILVQANLFEVSAKKCLGVRHLFAAPRPGSALKLGQQLPEPPARLEPRLIRRPDFVRLVEARDPPPRR